MVANLPIIMFILKAYILFFLVNVSLQTQNQESSAESPTLLDQLSEYMNKSHHDEVTLNSEKFDLCAPGVERNLICQAINMIQFGMSSHNVENQPCAKLFTPDQYFPCNMEDANTRQLRKGEGNTVTLETSADPISYPIPPPNSRIQLIDADYAEYERLSQSFKSEGKSPTEIGSSLEESSLHLNYKVALQITVEQLTESQEISNGFDVCGSGVNRGLLCQSINISLHNQCFAVYNAQCKGDKNKYFDCKMATGEVLRLKAGYSENFVVLEDDKNVAKFAVDVNRVSKFLQIKYILDNISKVGLPLNSKTTPIESSTST